MEYTDQAIPVWCTGHGWGCVGDGRIIDHWKKLHEESTDTGSNLWYCYMMTSVTLVTNLRHWRTHTFCDVISIVPEQTDRDIFSEISYFIPVLPQMYAIGHKICGAFIRLIGVSAFGSITSGEHDWCQRKLKEHPNLKEEEEDEEEEEEFPLSYQWIRASAIAAESRCPSSRLPPKNPLHCS